MNFQERIEALRKEYPLTDKGTEHPSLYYRDDKITHDRMGVPPKFNRDVGISPLHLRMEKNPEGHYGVPFFRGKILGGTNSFKAYLNSIKGDARAKLAIQEISKAEDDIALMKEKEGELQKKASEFYKKEKAWKEELTSGADGYKSAASKIGAMRIERKNIKKNIDNYNKAFQTFNDLIAHYKYMFDWGTWG